jgi:hypothetical protein
MPQGQKRTKFVMYKRRLGSRNYKQAAIRQIYNTLVVYNRIHPTDTMGIKQVACYQRHDVLTLYGERQETRRCNNGIRCTMTRPMANMSTIIMCVT